MKCILAPDSFKGSISSKKAADAMEKAIKETNTNATIKKFPIADGGEGTVDAFLSILGGVKVTSTVFDPLGREIKAEYGWIGETKTAIIETAAASGITLVDDTDRNPKILSTYGTGQLVIEALKKGATKIIIGLGGSATVDGGVGFLQALGIQFYKENGSLLTPFHTRLVEISRLSTENQYPISKDVEIIVASDVSNPLLGKNGAVHIFGPQKGVQKDEINAFETAMINYAKVVVRYVDKDEREKKGSGAAGGLGFALRSFLSAKVESGFSLLAREGKLDEEIASATIVITGEGKFDSQSKSGKVPVGIGRLAKKYHVPVIVFAGEIEDEMISLPVEGISLILPICDKPMNLQYAIYAGEELLYKATKRLFISLQLGRTL